MMLQYIDFTYNIVPGKTPAGMGVCPAGRSQKQLKSCARKEENYTSHFKYHI